MRSDKYKKHDKEDNIELEEEQKTPNRVLLFLKNIFITLVIIIILIFVYAHFIEPSFIKVNEYKVESNIIPDSFNGLKIIQFSDIHYGTTFSKKDLEKLIERINELNPDIIFFTGDLMDKNVNIDNKERIEIKKILSGLNANLNKYAVIGDNDNEKIFDEIFEGADFTILNNETKLLYYKDQTPIEIVGFNKDKTIDYSIINENEIYENIYKIVLIHKPDNIDNILTYNPNLILSGHTLGGLINIPGIKPLFLDKETKYYKRYYKIKNTEIYISNGLGTNSVTLRINNIPSINFYRLYKTL